MKKNSKKFSSLNVFALVISQSSTIEVKRLELLFVLVVMKYLFVYVTFVLFQFSMFTNFLKFRYILKGGYGKECK